MPGVERKHASTALRDGLNLYANLVYLYSYAVEGRGNDQRLKTAHDYKLKGSALQRQ